MYTRVCAYSIDPPVTALARPRLKVSRPLNSWVSQRATVASGDREVTSAAIATTPPSLTSGSRFPLPAYWSYIHDRPLVLLVLAGPHPSSETILSGCWGRVRGPMRGRPPPCRPRIVPAHVSFYEVTVDPGHCEKKCHIRRPRCTLQQLQANIDQDLHAAIRICTFPHIFSLLFSSVRLRKKEEGGRREEEEKEEEGVVWWWWWEEELHG